MCLALSEAAGAIMRPESAAARSAEYGKHLVFNMSRKRSGMVSTYSGQGERLSGRGVGWSRILRPVAGMGPPGAVSLRPCRSPVPGLLQRPRQASDVVQRMDLGGIADPGSDLVRPVGSRHVDAPRLAPAGYAQQPRVAADFAILHELAPDV
jgi:hypothetical protein